MANKEQVKKASRSVTMLFDPDLYDEVKSFAFLNKRKIYGVIEDAVREYLARHGGRTKGQQKR